MVDDVHGTGENADEPVLAVIPAAHRLDMAQPAVEHYYAYSAPLRLARACTDLPKLLRVWLLDCNGATLTAEEAQNPDLPQAQPGVHAPYEIKAGDHICIVVANDAEVPLSVALFDCAASGKVLLLGEKRVGARSKHVFWLGETLGTPFVAGLPNDVMVGVDRIAAIATTREDVSLRFLESNQTFEEILTPPTRGEPGSRDLGGEDLQDRGGAEEPPAESWTFALTALRIVRPD